MIINYTNEKGIDIDIHSANQLSSMHFMQQWTGRPKNNSITIKIVNVKL